MDLVKKNKKNAGIIGFIFNEIVKFTKKKIFKSLKYMSLFKTSITDNAPTIF